MENKGIMYKEKGITLVALIITIIVLVILAAVAISTVYQTGIVQYAMKGAQEYAEAGINENKVMNETADYMSSAVENIYDISEERTGEKILEAKLEIDEANVKETEIPVKVAEAKKNGEVLSENIIYTYYLDGVKKENKSTSNTYTFNNLDKEKSYTIKVVVQDLDGNYGVLEVKVLSFSVQGTYYRCTDAMTWREWLYSKYIKPVPRGEVSNGRFLDNAVDNADPFSFVWNESWGDGSYYECDYKDVLDNGQYVYPVTKIRSTSYTLSNQDHNDTRNPMKSYINKTKKY